MNDLHDLMYRASDGDPNRPDDPTRLLHQGRRRLRRHRGITAVSGLAVASLAVAGGVAWLPASSDGGGTAEQQPAVSSPVGDGSYDPAELSREEVGERCTTVLNNTHGAEATWFVPSFEHGPWFEGQTAMLTSDEFDNAGSVVASGPSTYGGNGEQSEGLKFTISCQVPQAELAATAGTQPADLPDPDDGAGVRAACGQYLGWDFAGWQVVTAAGTDIATSAVLRSTNGYVATCQLNAAPGPQGDSSWVTIDREKPPRTDPWEREYAVWFGNDQYTGDLQSGDYNIFWAGQVAGPEQVADITLTEPNGTVHDVSVADNGWYAIAEDMYLEMSPYGSTPLTITVYGEDGSVLAEYMDGAQSTDDGGQETPK